MAATLPCAAPFPETGSLSLLLARLLDDARSALDHYPDVAMGYIREALALLRTRTLPRRGGGGSIAKGGLAPWQVGRVKDHIAANLAGRLSDASLADLFDLSAGHFSRSFKVSVGLSPHAYIMDRRVEASMQMMLLDNTPLAEIAIACGLADQAHFCHVFRRHVGLTPAAWRRRTQSEAAQDDCRTWIGEMA